MHDMMRSESYNRTHWTSTSKLLHARCSEKHWAATASLLLGIFFGFILLNGQVQNRFVLLNGLVQTALFCLMDRYDCWCLVHNKELPVPKGWNSRLPTSTWERQIYQCKEMPVLRGWNSWFPTWDQSLPRFPKVGTDSSQPGYHRLQLQRTSSSRMLKITAANLGTTGYH